MVEEAQAEGVVEHKVEEPIADEPEKKKEGYSEKRKERRLKAKLSNKGKKHLRLSAVWPFLFSLVACVLVIMLVVSGSRPGRLQNIYLVAVCPSKSFILALY